MAKTQANSSDNEQVERVVEKGSEWVISALAVVGIAIIVAIAGIAVFNAKDPMAGLSEPKVAVHEEPANHATPAHTGPGAGHGVKQDATSEEQQQQEHMQFVKQLNERLDKNPKDHEAMLMLANTYMMIRDFKKAEPLYHRVLELEPKQLAARSNLALIALQDKKYDESAKLLEQNIKENPQHGESVYNLGFVYGKYQNDPQKALALWKKWLEENPQHPVNEQLKPLYTQLQQSLQKQ